MAFSDEQIAAFPPWLQKIAKMTPAAREAAGYLDEDVDQAARAYHIDKDYTQKSQEAAELRKSLAGMTPENAARALAWWQENQAELNEVWKNKERLKAPQSAPAPTNGAGKRRWQDADVTVLYETASMREMFESVEDSAYERGVAARNDWYAKEVAPNWDKQASGYLSTAVDLIGYAQDEAVRAARDPKYTPIGIQELLKESAARGERDFRKVAQAVHQERSGLVKSVEDDAFKRGVEEGKKAAATAAEGPSGPHGASAPMWRPPAADQTPKNPAELRAYVLDKVEKRRGEKLPL